MHSPKKPSSFVPVLKAPLRWLRSKRRRSREWEPDFCPAKLQNCPGHPNLTRSLTCPHRSPRSRRRRPRRPKRAPNCDPSNFVASCFLGAPEAASWRGAPSHTYGRMNGQPWGPRWYPRNRPERWSSAALLSATATSGLVAVPQHRLVRSLRRDPEARECEISQDRPGVLSELIRWRVSRGETTGTMSWWVSGFRAPGEIWGRL